MSLAFTTNGAQTLTTGGIMFPQFNTATDFNQFPPITSASTGAVTKVYGYLL